MMQLLTALEGSGFSTWLRESTTIWAYPTVLTLHTFGLMVLVGVSWALDLRLLGFGRRIPLGAMRALFPVMWIGLWINAATGTMLFAADAVARAASPVFLAKLFFIALGVGTVVLIKRHVYGAAADPAVVSGTAKLLAIASFLVWIAAITAGRLLAYIK